MEPKHKSSSRPTRQLQNFKNIPVKDWPVDDRPREKLLKWGEHTLSDAELIAILIRTGTRGISAIDLGRRILQKFKTFRQMSHTDISQWREIVGLGNTKICQIKAAIEIGRRFITEERKKEGPVKSSREVADLMMPRLRDLKKEVFKILLLDGQNNVNNVVEMDEGTVTQATPSIREIISRALQDFAAAIVAVHNHPSGDPHPSEGDKEFTRELVSAGEIMQIKVLDHIIIGDNKYFSFADEGLL
ncbi:hypothetical protein COS91_03150 [Candidatus Desantisbacteria bacterium CG07_land_8_20_14_0_80_39_15]|uniref:MPN domain-containing protein n=2 Tax=unclassified Candidatus Desantisiibacteriota TaxID=3106372 RepID=A0A2H9PB86_9BACT|nr:MAG: hypothetical protein COS91_03150 [Candidatus Desantisbacteria bacterium CG07_land_8_20_14_0_80_39_15]PIZ15008.1 MAG: hypothetical protein COY51_06690 [Candidatus Desantisbacteria bacterium CG_4_10_14_0_8_um_filter_39_17]